MLKYGVMEHKYVKSRNYEINTLPKVGHGA